MIHVKLAAINKPENAVELMLGRLGALFVKNKNINIFPEDIFCNSTIFRYRRQIFLVIVSEYKPIK